MLSNAGARATRARRVKLSLVLPDVGVSHDDGNRFFGGGFGPHGGQQPCFARDSSCMNNREEMLILCSDQIEFFHKKITKEKLDFFKTRLSQNGTQKLAWRS